jgi:hypothetical protein
MLQSALTFSTNHTLAHTESGILADFSSLSPEECLENPLWPSSGISLKKSNSILTSVSASSGASVSTTSSSSSSANSTSYGKSNGGGNLKDSTLVSSTLIKTINNNNSIGSNSNSNSVKKDETSAVLDKASHKSNSNSSISDVYLNENNVTVHL